MTLYRKTGRVARWENGTLVRVVESGVAVEEEGRFSCRPEPAGADLPDASHLAEIARSIRERVAVRIERLILIEGEAAHAFGEKEWRDETRRLHLSLTNGRIRALVDLADFDLAAIAPVADALARAGAEREAPPRLRLAPNVAAALLPSLLGIAPPNVTLAQKAGGVDGYGNPVEDAGEPWPNAYRPSYRIRPVRMPFNLIASCTVTGVDEELPRAVAILAPPDGLALRVLVDDRGSVYPATVRVARIDAIGTDTTWFPYAAGVHGAEIVL